MSLDPQSFEPLPEDIANFWLTAANSWVAQTGWFDESYSMRSNHGLVAEPAQNPPLSTLRVLYIDDDENDFLLAQIACKRSQAPFSLISARSGNEALQWLTKTNQEGRPLPHMILLDVNIESRKDGLEVLKTLRHRPELSHIPVILLSGVIDPPLLAQAHQLGAKDLIEKTGDSQFVKRLVQMATNVRPELFAGTATA